MSKSNGKSSTITFWELIKIILTIVFVLVLIYSIITPSLVVPLIFATYPDSGYPLNETVATEHGTYTLYSNNKNKNDKLFVWFNGGAFLRTDKRQNYGMLNYMYDRLKGIDLVVIDYPTRFKATIQESVIAINDVLRENFLHYNEYHAGGISAGVLLLGAFCQKEASAQAEKDLQIPKIGINFKSLTCLCGVYCTDFGSTALNQLFNLYLLRGSPGKQWYTCYNLQMPKMVVTSYHDFLFYQSFHYKTKETGTEYIIYEKELIHGFPLWLNIPEGNEALTHMAAFIMKNVNLQKKFNAVSNDHQNNPTNNNIIHHRFAGLYSNNAHLTSSEPLIQKIIKHDRRKMLR